MSYDPSQNQGSRAIQIDIDGASVVSSDIVTHTRTSFRSTRMVYFIDHKYFLTTDTNLSGRILYSAFEGFLSMGSVYRSNLVTGLNTITDNCCHGVNARNVTLLNSESSSGSGNLTYTTFKAYWRIL